MNIENKNPKSKIIYPIGGYAPGFYTNKCVNCEEQFMGDKLATQCEPCAINTINKSYTKVLHKLMKLESALKQVKLNNDVINELINKQ